MSLYTFTSCHKLSPWYLLSYFRSCARTVDTTDVHIQCAYLAHIVRYYNELQ